MTPLAEPEAAWTVAIDADGTPRPADETGLPVTQVAELTRYSPTPSGRAGQPAWGSWYGGNVPILVRSSSCSKPTVTGATKRWPPTP